MPLNGRSINIRGRARAFFNSIRTIFGGNERFPIVGEAVRSKKMVGRKFVVVFLCLTFLVPIILCTDRLPEGPISILKGAFVEEASNRVEEIGAVSQEVPYSGESVESVKSLDNLEDGLTSVENLESSPGKSEECKRRILSEAVDWGKYGQVTNIEEKIHSGENKQKGLQFKDIVLDKEENELDQKLEQGNPNDHLAKWLQFTVSNIKGVRTANPDEKIRQLKDQLIRANVYLNLSATKSNPPFIRELRARVRNVQRILGDATVDEELPKGSSEQLKEMEQVLVKGKKINDDCSDVIKRLRTTVKSSELQLQTHQKQTHRLTQLAAKTLPKGLHCLSLRLSIQYYSLNTKRQQFPNQEKLEDPNLYHYALFSDNVLAASVVVNSTVTNAQNPENHVFHVVTDKLNYAAMRMWFLSNPPGKATINVQNVEEFTWLNSSYSPVMQQLGSRCMIDYYFRNNHASLDANLKFRNPKYLSILNHLRFYLPEIFPKLRRMVFLDDDIVVQKDLTALWSLDMKGKVNGAVETCGERFHRFDRYLNFSNPLIVKNFDPRACGWAFGMNVFDLTEWKKQNITKIYHSWQKLNANRLLWKLGTLPAGLITFYDRVFPLNGSWHVLGLGYNSNVNIKQIEQAAVIHYNGNKKPWLEIGMRKYRSFWSRRSSW